MPGDENTAQKIERVGNGENLVRGPNDFGGGGGVCWVASLVLFLSS
jgi:hypothetical protein